MNEAVVANRSQMNNVEELMKILVVANMLHEQQQVGLLMNHIAESEKNHAAVMQELAGIKEQLNELLSRTENASEISKSRKAFSTLTEQTEVRIKAQGEKIQSIKQDLNQKAKHVVQGFKNTGVKALNGVCSFLGIQEKLIAMRDQARSAEVDMKNAVEKIDAVEKELSGAATHLGNAGRIVTGREKSMSEERAKTQDEKKGPALFRLLRNYYQKHQDTYAKRVEKLNGAIEKCRTLEQKASVLKQLSENKEKVAAKEKDVDAGRSTPVSEHKKDENIR